MNSEAINILKPILVKKGIVGEKEKWKPLSGGRSNDIWRIGENVCKLYKQSRSSELFPNNPANEEKLLRYLSGTSIAPEPIYFEEFELGPVLVYEFVEGPVFKTPSKEIARLLSRLHTFSIKDIKLNVRNSSSGHLLKQCKDLLIGKNCNILSLPHDPKISDIVNQSLIHCDPVAGNVVDNGKNGILIDWQCCAIGDASEDIACALSPAMQYLYGEGELDFTTRQNFLAAYGNDKIIDRYKALGHLYHCRIAAYCLWRAQQGDKDYEKAFLEEKIFLDAVYG